MLRVILNRDRIKVVFILGLAFVVEMLFNWN